jgi:hypothetical protein
MSNLDNVTVLVTCPGCGRPSQGPVTGEVVTVVTSSVGQFVPVESLDIRDDLIDALQQQASRLRVSGQVSDALNDRIGALMIEHEKLRQADR